MSTQVTGLQVFTNNEMSAQTAALDGKGPFAGNVYKVFVNTPKHHLTDADGGESNFAGSGYTVYATILGMDANQAVTAFPQNDAGTDFKIVGYVQENGAVKEALNIDYQGVKIVKRTLTEGKTAIDGNPNAGTLNYASFEFTYTKGTYSEVGGTAKHLTPNQGN